MLKRALILPLLFPVFLSAQTAVGKSIGSNPGSIVVPKYPTLAKIGRVEGKVKPRIKFDKHGKAKDTGIECDKNLLMLAKSVMDSISKWRLPSEAGKTIHILFEFKLLPYNSKDFELETEISLYSKIVIHDRLSPPVENGIINDPSPEK